MTQDQTHSPFWSIERAVAFVIAPLVTPLSGALALWLGKHFPGVHVSSTSIAAFASTTSLGVAGGFIKWLDGRQKFVAHVTALESTVGTVLAPLPVKDRESLLQDIETIIVGHVGRLAKLIRPAGAVVGDSSAAAATASGGSAAATFTPANVEQAIPDPAAPNAEDPSWSVPNDPAPATPPDEPAPVGDPSAPQPSPAVADAGAAVVGS